MTKILVLSDSHGNVNNMIYAVRREKPDQIFHLGDCWTDAQRLKKEFPDIVMEQVPGNCDYRNERLSRTLQIEGFDIFLTHGHLYHVKEGFSILRSAAEQQHFAVVLFGHTHKVYYDKHNGVTYLNPGSIGAPGSQAPPSYGILTLDQKRSLIQTDVHYIEFSR